MWSPSSVYLTPMLIQVRKIRCDALPEGCSHCLNQNLECYVTDRVSGRTERRGYMQELEREKTDMMTHIRELEKRLQQNGLDVKPWHSTSFPATPTPDTNGNGTFDIAAVAPSTDPAPKDPWTHPHAPVWVKDRAGVMPMADSPHNTSNNRPLNTHLGVSTDHEALHSIKGTTLTILGSTIDIGSFNAPDMDEPPPSTSMRAPLYNKSVKALMMSAMNVNPEIRVDFPPRSDAFTYAEWYFVMIHPFHPVLHKPSFMTMLGKIYDDPSFNPTAADTVTIHMVFAAIYLQYGIRGREQPEQRAHLNDLSNKHYHYALSKLYEVDSLRTLEAVQALSMLCTHTMRFPKPDSSSILASHALTMAVELGYHRAWKKPGEGTNLENELRKRVFWTILSTTIVLRGRMGKPMPIRLEDIDVEFPEMIPDELLTKDGVDTTRQGRCPFEIGVVSAKLSTLYLEMYANIYCARKDPKRYLAVVEGLEAQLQSWRDHLPDGLKIKETGSAESETRMSAIYADWSALEFRLCLRHPSVAVTDDPEMIANNTKICEETAKGMLNSVRKLYKLKCLDTTWYCNAVYVAAIFSDLVGHWERRHATTVAEVQALREDMEVWLVVLAETGSLMGSGTRLRDAVSSIIDRTIAWIERDRLQSEGNRSRSQPRVKQEPPTPPYTNVSTSSNTDQTQAHTPERLNDSKQHMAPQNQANYYPENNPDPNTYQPIHYAETNAHTPSSISYGPDSSYVYSQPGTTQAQAHAEAQIRAQAHAQAQAQAHVQAQTHSHNVDHNPLTTFATTATQMAQPDMMWRPQSSGGNTWQDWTAAVVDNQDRYSADALMSLGSSNNSRPAANVVNGHGVNDIGMSTMGMQTPAMTTTAQMQWPLILFSDGVGNGV
ncbi:hypothetical protein GGR57DRAFT_42818 [Xylariaceae sp. FL1272]|nr:hypothetical protein GGR57DRAFT_42818 [Xylariaceae sp. FL1272]